MNLFIQALVLSVNFFFSFDTSQCENIENLRIICKDKWLRSHDVNFGQGHFLPAYTYASDGFFVNSKMAATCERSI